MKVEENIIEKRATPEQKIFDKSLDLICKIQHQMPCCRHCYPDWEAVPDNKIKYRYENGEKCWVIYRCNKPHPYEYYDDDLW